MLDNLLEWSSASCCLSNPVVVLRCCKAYQVSLAVAVLSQRQTDLIVVRSELQIRPIQIPMLLQALPLRLRLSPVDKGSPTTGFLCEPYLAEHRGATPVRRCRRCYTTSFSAVVQGRRVWCSDLKRNSSSEVPTPTGIVPTDS